MRCRIKSRNSTTRSDLLEKANEMLHADMAAMETKKNAEIEKLRIARDNAESKIIAMYTKFETVADIMSGIFDAGRKAPLSPRPSTDPDIAKLEAEMMKP